MSSSVAATAESATSGFEWGGLEVESASYAVRPSIRDLGELLRRAGCIRPMLVLSREAVVASGLLDELQATLDGFETVCFDEFTPNPTDGECALATEFALDHNADSVVGIGGGTAMDIAKLAAVGVGSGGRLGSVLHGDVAFPDRVPPIFAAPTTSGTGAEATHFSAVYIDGTKHSIAHESMRPRGVVLDARFHRVMPARLAAVTGLDALCQALESIWAVGATEESAAFAHRAANIVSAAIVSSVQRGDERSRESMMLGAHLAGHAINISKTTLAHALSYALTQRYGVPHGHAVALLLGAVAEANAVNGAADVAGPAIDHLGCDADEVVHKVRSLLVRLGLAPTLADVGVPRADLTHIAQSVDPVRMSNNPIQFDHDQLVRLLLRAWGE
jgi:alcohol dehydrogenase class IV